MSEPTDLVRISIMPYQDENTKEWCVRMMVTGLPSERQALLAADHMAALFCGSEILAN